MDCKNLMIGDWVCYDGDTEYSSPIRVTGLDLGDVATDDDGWIGGNECVLIPIPLTEEILVANGICLNDDINEDGVHYRLMQSLYEDIMQPCRVFDINNGAHFMFTSNNIKYVHELQHAIRLCGLTELADNFKVEGGVE